MSTPASPSPQDLIGAVEDRAWVELGRCRGRSDLFFEPFRELAPQRAIREQAAKSVCDRCPVREPCRDSGRRNHESGIWGGETEEERVRAGFPIRSVARSSVMVAHRAAASASASDPIDPQQADPQPAPARDAEVA